MNYLISYPRSGNTFLRYCIEYMTGYKTSGITSEDKPILERLGEPLNKNSILQKIHFPKDININIKSKNLYILLIRDYKYCCKSQLTRDSERDKKCDERYITNICIEWCNLIHKCYDNSLIIYYNDFMKNSVDTCQKICDYIGIQTIRERKEHLIKNYKYHFNRCRQIYVEKHGESKNSFDYDDFCDKIVKENLKEKYHFILELI